MQTGNKHNLADVLTENVKCPGSGNAALFINGFALVVAIGKPEKEKTFGGFAD